MPTKPSTFDTSQKQACFLTDCANNIRLLQSLGYRGVNVLPGRQNTTFVEVKPFRSTLLTKTIKVLMAVAKYSPTPGK